MKTISTNKLLYYSHFKQYGNTFIETGSAAGDGIQRALDAGFDDVTSIEANENWFRYCMHRYISDLRVKLHLGKSVDVLRNLIVSKKNKNIIFFLDAHPAGPTTAGHDEVIAGNSEYGQDQIIKNELTVILARFNEPVIMIDDQAGISPTSNYYIDMISEKHPGYIFEFYDENLSGDHLYKNKILVARPA
jgi:hypothetical protein